MAPPGTDDCTAQHYPGADPWFTLHEDGTITTSWPEGIDQALCSRDLIENVVANVNKLRDLLREALDEMEICGTWFEIDPALRHAEITRIRREAGL